jgi:hypothetical protein
VGALIGRGEAQVCGEGRPRAGARAVATNPRSAGLTRRRARVLCFYPSLNVHRLQIFAYLGMITIQDMLPRRSFVVCVWKSSGLGLCTVSCRVAKMSVSQGRVPR